jgi:hypothetical protein
MKAKETITWNPIQDGPPKKEGLYLVNRQDGRYSAVIMESWAGVPYQGPGSHEIFPQWDGDPPQGGPRDGAYPEEGPVVAWAEMPVGLRGDLKVERRP